MRHKISPIIMNFACSPNMWMPVAAIQVHTVPSGLAMGMRTVPWGDCSKFLNHLLQMGTMQKTTSHITRLQRISACRVAVSYKTLLPDEVKTLQRCIHTRPSAGESSLMWKGAMIPFAYGWRTLKSTWPLNTKTKFPDFYAEPDHQPLKTWGAEAERASRAVCTVTTMFVGC